MSSSLDGSLTSPSPRRPFWKKKRYIIPAASLAALIVIGEVSPQSKPAQKIASSPVNVSSPSPSPSDSPSPEALPPSLSPTPAPKPTPVATKAPVRIVAPVVTHAPVVARTHAPPPPPPPPPVPPTATSFANCTAMHAVYPHGVGLPGAVDHVRGSTAPVTDFVRSTALYNANSGSDRDHDGVACEAA